MAHSSLAAGDFALKSSELGTQSSDAAAKSDDMKPATYVAALTTDVLEAESYRMRPETYVATLKTDVLEAEPYGMKLATHVPGLRSQPKEAITAPA